MNILDELADGILTGSAVEMESVGQRLAASLPENLALALGGDLGSGKTTLVRGIARGMGIRKAVTSPTYNIYTIYQGTRQLVHMDAYRLETARDLDQLSIEEFLHPPFLIAVEWPEHVPGFFEDFHTFRMQLALLPDGRHSVTLLKAG